VSAGLARADRNSVVMVLKRQVDLQETIGSVLDIQLLGALVQNDGPILRDAAHISVPPMVNIEIGVALSRRFRNDREFDASPIGPAVRPSQQVIVQPRSVTQDQVPVSIQARGRAVDRKPMDRFNEFRFHGFAYQPGAGSSEYRIWDLPANPSSGCRTVAALGRFQLVGCGAAADLRDNRKIAALSLHSGAMGSSRGFTESAPECMPSFVSSST
jgi:hypothetical protein